MHLEVRLEALGKKGAEGGDLHLAGQGVNAQTIAVPQLHPRLLDAAAILQAICEP